MQENESTGLDFNELAKLITAELDSSLRTINTVTPWSSRFHVSSMRVQIGHLPPDQGDSNTATETNDSPDKFCKTLLNQRYQLADRGWMLAVELAAGGAPAKIKVLDEPIATLPAEKYSSAASLFRDLPVDAIRGVNTKWMRHLKKFQIVTVGDLIEMGYDIRNKLIRETEKKYPLVIHSRAKQLLVAAPQIPSSKIDGEPLYALISKPPYMLRKLIGEQIISITACEQLSDFLSLLYSVLDSKILKEFTVLQLREIYQRKITRQDSAPQ